MAQEFRLPKLGENIAAGVVVRVLASPGQAVEVDQPVLEVETDKAVAEVPSTVRGTVREVHVKEGDEVKPGDLVFTVETGMEEAGKETEPQSAGAEGRGAGAGLLPSRQREMGASVQEAAAPRREVSVAERPAAARREPKFQGDGRDAPGNQGVDGALSESSLVRVQSRTVVPAAPSTRRFAREIGVDIAEVPGTGPNGRISIEDVKAYARSLNRRRAAPPGPAASPAIEPLPDFSRWGDVERRPMRGIRRKTAEHLSRAWAAPHVTQFDKADVTELEKLRKRYAPRVEVAGGKLTPTAILLKVVAAALKVFPQFNASVDAARGEIIYRKYCHIGIAVDTEHGLVVPVLRDVDKKNLVELAVELTQIAKKARERKLSAEEMQGGCFTVSNLGGIGGTAFTPILNAPEVAILGVARAAVEPVWDGTGFVPRTMLPLCLSYDHRAIDGADGARFLRWVAEALEQPFVLLLEG